MDNEISSIISTYKDDMNNLHSIEDYELIEYDIEVPMMINLISMTEAITSENKGLFTDKLNNKYTIISKDKLKANITQIFKYLLSNKTNPSFLNDNIVSLDLCNIILLTASGNNTIYYLKKKLLVNCKNIIEDTILSEYTFTQLINIKNRKCCISWDYRFFLIKNYGNMLFEYYNNNTDSNKARSFSIKSITNSMQVNITASNFVFNDLEYLLLINVREKRNYHLWTYLNQMFNYCQRDDDKRTIFCFACYLFVNDFNDYSAFSFIINFHSKGLFSVKEYSGLLHYLIQISQANQTDSNKYFTQICKLLTNIK